MLASHSAIADSLILITYQLLIRSAKYPMQTSPIPNKEV